MARAEFLSSKITTFRVDNTGQWRVGVELYDTIERQRLVTGLSPAEAIALGRELYAMAYDALDRQSLDDKQRTS